MRKLFYLFILFLFINTAAVLADFDGVYDWGFDNVYIPDMSDPDFDAETDIPHFNEWSISAGAISSSVSAGDGAMGLYEDFGEPYNGVSFNEGGIMDYQVAPPGQNQNQYNNRGYMAVSTINSFALPVGATENRYEFGVNMDWYSGASESDHLYMLIYKDTLAKPVDFVGSLNDYLYSEIISSPGSYQSSQVWTNESGSQYLDDMSDLGWGIMGAEDVNYYRSGFTFEQGSDYKMTIMMTFDGYSLNSAGVENPYSTLGIDQVIFREAPATPAVPVPGAFVLASAGVVLVGRFKRRHI